MPVSLRILHLEDNPRDAQMIRDLLDGSDFKCHIERATNRQSYEAALTHGAFDLVLCDNNLPDYNGQAALALARAKHPLTPVVIISGSMGEEEAVRNLQLGATDYLLKDRLERLVPAMQRALEEAAERRRRQRAEALLRRNEERMRLALAATNDGIWDWDLGTGQMECNETFETHFGRPTDNAALREWWAARIPADERDDVLASLDSAIANSAQLWSRTYRLRRRDGRLAHVHNRVCLEQNDAGRVVRLVGAIQDVTESIEAENVRRTLEEQLRQAQKLEAIGTLAGGIAHDFNNIIGIILTNAGLASLDLPLDLPPDHGTVESLAEITAAANRARDLVRQILAFSRRSESQFTLMKVQPIVNECVQMLRSTIPAMVSIKTSIDPACACINGDPTQIHQVVMNLCTNAWHALPESGGALDVRVDEIAAVNAPAAVQTDIAVENLVRLVVADNGHGMDAKTRERIFEPFFTTKPAGHGTGLGLAVVHGIIKSHGGTITVASSPGRGTTFEIFFPAQAQAPEVRPATGLSVPRGAGQAIMVVDDDVAMGRSTQRFLLHQGYRVDLFHTPGAALEAFVDNPTGYDLIVTDFSMPLMSGLDLAEKLKLVRADVPIVLATGSVGFADQHRARLDGLCRFLPKPVAPQALAQAVAEALRPELAPERPRHE